MFVHAAKEEPRPLEESVDIEPSMSKREKIETILGKRCKYEIVRETGSWTGSAKFYILKDGESHRGPFGDLRDAVQRAKDDAAREG